MSRECKQNESNHAGKLSCFRFQADWNFCQSLLSGGNLFMKNHLVETEHDIMGVIHKYLNDIGMFVWRSNAGRYPITDNYGKKRMIIGAPSGTPDLIGVIGPKFRKGVFTGKFIGLEIKKPGNKPTDLQNRVMGELRDHGAIVLVVHSVEELEEQLKKL